MPSFILNFLGDVTVDVASYHITESEIEGHSASTASIFWNWSPSYNDSLSSREWFRHALGWFQIIHHSTRWLDRIVDHTQKCYLMPFHQLGASPFGGLKQRSHWNFVKTDNHRQYNCFGLWPNTFRHSLIFFRVSIFAHFSTTLTVYRLQ